MKHEVPSDVTLNKQIHEIRVSCKSITPLVLRIFMLYPLWPIREPTVSVPLASHVSRNLSFLGFFPDTFSDFPLFSRDISHTPLQILDLFWLVLDQPIFSVFSAPPALLYELHGITYSFLKAFPYFQVGIAAFVHDTFQSFHIAHNEHCLFPWLLPDDLYATVSACG